jgi:hypothetical protein
VFIYSVSVAIESTIEADWLHWMQNTHIPAVVQTGYFSGYELLRQVELETQDLAHYQIRYFCDFLKNLHDYRANCAPQLQAEHTGRYQGRFTASRAVYERVG